MSNAYYCDGCKGSFPIEKVNKLTFEAMKWGRNHDSAIETHKARETCLCDTCFEKLMKEKTVAKLPWSKWTKDDNCDD